jgi:hypothetical protein
MHGYSMLRYEVRAKFPGLAVGTRSPLVTPLFSDHHRGGYDIDDMRMLGIGRNEMVPAVDSIMADHRLCSLRRSKLLVGCLYSVFCILYSVLIIRGTKRDIRNPL